MVFPCECYYSNLGWHLHLLLEGAESDFAESDLIELPTIGFQI